MQVNEDTIINANLYAKSQTYAAGSIGNSAIAALAGISASKLQHRHKPPYAQEASAASVAETKFLYVVKGATATINDFQAGPIVAAAGGDRACTVDLKKNGSSILTAVITLDSGKAAYSKTSAAGFTSTSLVAGDVLTVVVARTGSTGTYPFGVWAIPDIDEDAV